MSLAHRAALHLNLFEQPREKRVLFASCQEALRPHGRAAYPLDGSPVSEVH